MATAWPLAARAQAQVGAVASTDLTPTATLAASSWEIDGRWQSGPAGGGAPATQAAAASSEAALPEANQLSYRLDIWGDLFTPQEKDLLQSSSQFLSLGRSVRRVESSTLRQRNNQEGAGSALAPAISSSLVYDGGWGADASASPITWGQPGGSLARALERQAVPMASDWAERSRGGDPWAELDGAAVWVERAAAIMPSPGRGIGWQAGTASARVGIMGLVSGDWPDFGRMGASDFAGFCRVWFERTANAALATGLGNLMEESNCTPERAGAGHRPARPRPALPVTLFSYAY